MSILIAAVLAAFHFNTHVGGGWYRDESDDGIYYYCHTSEWPKVEHEVAYTNASKVLRPSFSRNGGIAIVTNEGFTVAYDKSTMNPAWVAYDLEPSEVIRMKRVPHDFNADRRLPCTTNVPSFYREFGGKYDRGHLAPAADFNWNTNALKQTYLFSNVAPMLRQLNRGRWLDNENEVRRLAESGTVHIVMFPKYENCQQKYHGVAIPKSFVKVAWGWFGVRMWNEENEE